MKFCPVCQNMLYMQTKKDENDERDVLFFVCKNCQYNEIIDKKRTEPSVPILYGQYHPAEPSSLDAASIMKVNYDDDARSYKKYQTANIKYDMTLPRVSNIPCPRKCQDRLSPEEKKDPEVILIKYDPMGMKYLYFCCHCEHFWKLES